ncbi:hypothetical protein MHU86_24062 [Fragilaria crotonensis]|nr:hypothetical protein MHU86_24062 [Fragilaria crotonensis]
MSSNNSTAGDTNVSGLTTETGRSGGRAGRGGQRNRSGRSGRGQQSGRGSHRPPRTTGFKRTTTEMNGNVFECYDEQTDRRQYAKTVEALEGYAKKNLKYAEDLATLFATEMKLPTLEKPTSKGAKTKYHS